MERPEGRDVDIETRLRTVFTEAIDLEPETDLSSFSVARKLVEELAGA